MLHTALHQPVYEQGARQGRPLLPPSGISGKAAFCSYGSGGGCTLVVQAFHNRKSDRSSRAGVMAASAARRFSRLGPRCGAPGRRAQPRPPSWRSALVRRLPYATRKILPVRGPDGTEGKVARYVGYPATTLPNNTLGLTTGSLAIFCCWWPSVYVTS